MAGQAAVGAIQAPAEEVMLTPEAVRREAVAAQVEAETRVGMVLVAIRPGAEMVEQCQVMNVRRHGEPMMIFLRGVKAN